MSSDHKNSYKFFFYGTLKRHEPNHFHLKNRNVKFISEAITMEKWPLIVATDFNIPYMVNKRGFGFNVKGEIYIVDQEAKDFLDDFECVKEELYSLIEINVKDDKNQIHKVYAYLLDNYKENLLENHSLIDSYTSNDHHCNSFVKKIDWSNHIFDHIYKQIKE